MADEEKTTKESSLDEIIEAFERLKGTPLPSDDTILLQGNISRTLLARLREVTDQI